MVNGQMLSLCRPPRTTSSAEEKYCCSRITGIGTTLFVYKWEEVERASRAFHRRMRMRKYTSFQQTYRPGFVKLFCLDSSNCHYYLKLLLGSIGLFKLKELLFFWQKRSKNNFEKLDKSTMTEN